MPKCKVKETKSKLKTQGKFCIRILQQYKLCLLLAWFLNPGYGQKNP
jgi:hypothetical protein